MGRGVVWHAGPVDRPVPSMWGEGAGSMGGQAGPSQRESERERDPHTTRYSSELGFYGSPRNIYTLSSFFWRTVYQISMKIGDPQAQLPILLRDSKNLGECLA